MLSGWLWNRKWFCVRLPCVLPHASFCCSSLASSPSWRRLFRILRACSCTQACPREVRSRNLSWVIMYICRHRVQNGFADSFVRFLPSFVLYWNPPGRKYPVHSRFHDYEHLHIGQNSSIFVIASTVAQWLLYTCLSPLVVKNLGTFSHFLPSFVVRCLRLLLFFFFDCQVQKITMFEKHTEFKIVKLSSDQSSIWSQIWNKRISDSLKIVTRAFKLI